MENGLKLSENEPIWKKKVITGRMNQIPLSELYGENWVENAVNESLKRDMSSWRVFIPTIDYSKCKKCWMCFDYCPEGVISKSDEGPIINRTLCKGCGICATECPFKAIEMERE